MDGRGKILAKYFLVGEERRKGWDVKK